MARNPSFKLRQGAILAFAINYAFSPVAYAGLPQGASVVNGQVTITQPSSGVMNVRASNGSIINWNQFSIGAGDLVRFVQPTASSAVLNRVVGSQVSEIMGRLEANGRVFLINPNGIVFGPGARVDTNGFLASTLSLSDADFLAGKLRFLGDASSGTIRNEGLITVAPGGSVALIAPNIENAGIIQAPGGHLLLAAGRRIEIASLDFDGVTFEVQAPADTVLNLGKLLADNGAIQVFAGSLRHSGEIRANRMTQDADGSIRLVGSSEVVLTADSVTRADGPSGGNITIQSPEGTTRVGGLVSAVGSEGRGGDIRLLGERVAVESGATVDASGASGGGQILVGGDYQGSNAEVQNAKRVFIGEGARLVADATGRGNGGRVIVWSDETTRFLGSISARGGILGGNGGFAEVSGAHDLLFSGGADLTAPLGEAGFLLLDPLDIIVSTIGGILPIVTDQFADLPTNILTISPTGLNQLGGNVILQAKRDVYFNSSTVFTGTSLTVQANGDNATGSIYLNQSLSASNGSVTLSGYTLRGSGNLSSAGTTTVNVTGNIDSNYTGSVSGSTVALTSSGGSINSLEASGGNVTLSGQSGVFNSTVSASGNAALNSAGGSLNNNTVTAGNTATFTAPGSINANYVRAARINADSSGSYVRLYNQSGYALNLGLIDGASGVYLYSNAGMRQVAGGSIIGPFVQLDGQDASGTLGTSAAPLQVDSPSLTLSNLGGGAFIDVVNTPTLTGLSLDGSLAALAATEIAGAPNLDVFDLSAGSGVLNANVQAASGLTSFALNVSNAGLAFSNLNVPSASVSLVAGGGGVSYGNATVGSLNVTAAGSITGTSVTSTGSISLYAAKCSQAYPYPLCADTSNITATSLTSSGGSITLDTDDNGTVNVGTLSAAGSASVSAGRVYYSYTNSNNNVTTNSIILGTVTTGSSFTATNTGTGNLTVSGPITAGGTVTLNAGSQYYNYQLGQNVRTTSAISAAGDISGTRVRMTNSGTGAITANGTLTASSTDITLNAQNGALTATGAHSAGTSASYTAGNGNLTLGTVTTTNGSVSGTATNGNLSFTSIAANGSNRDVTLTATNGTLTTTQDNAGADISATGNVTLSATNGIGDASFARPLDIVAGSTGTVQLTSPAGSVGAVGKAINVDTQGTLRVSAGGQFHVSAQDMSGTARTLRAIDLTAGASGMGVGGTSVLSSLDLSVNASSDGSTITIGDIVQAANTLDAFKFTASGSSALVFGNASLTTAGLNDLTLAAGNGLTQTLPGTNNVVGGLIDLDGGSGAVVVGDVTSSTAAVGNKIRIDGADITAGDLAGLDISVSGANLVLGAVAASGTRRGFPGSYLLNPHTGSNEYVTEDLTLSASGSITTAGNVSSATSVSVTAANGITVNGGTGSITGGTTYNGYYVDSANVAAGTGTLASGAILAYNTTVSGNTLNTGALTANGGNLTVSGTTFNTGNLTATSTVDINATDAYVPGAITIAAGATVNITAPNGIDTTLATITTPTAYLQASDGAVVADLTGTTSLYQLIAGGAIDVTSTAALTSLYVQAKGDQLGGASSIIAPGQTFTLTSSGSNANLTWNSATAVTARYTERSDGVTVSDVNVAGNFGAAGSSLQIYGSESAINVNGFTGAGTQALFNTDGNVTLNSLATGGGSVTAQSYSGDITVGSVATLGSAANLSAYSGSILGTGAATINTANNLDDPSGSVTLYAANGSIGSGGTPIVVNKTVSLTLNAADTIAVDLNNTTLTNLYITTRASGSGSISIVNNPNYAGFSLTRGTAELVLGPVTPASAGSFHLTASDGSIRVNGDISVVDLRLDTNSSTGDVLIAASGGPRSVVASGSLFLDAGRDVKILAGAAVGENVLVQGAYQSSNIGRDLIVQGDGGSALLNLSSGSVQTVSVGRDIRVLGGSNGTGSSAGITSSGSQNLYASNDVIVQGGASDSASALLQGDYQDIRSNNLSVLAGGGTDATARILGDYQYISEVRGDLSVLGGAGTNAFAEIVSASDQSLGNQSTYFHDPTGSVLIQGGTGSGTYASVRAGSGQTLYGGGTISVLGGSGNGAYAEVVSASTQTVGYQYQYFYDPTDALLVQGGSGIGAYASIRAASTQVVQSRNDIQVLGGSGTGAGSSGACGTGPGAFAEICTSGAQYVGETQSYVFGNAPTDDILVQGGSGGNARIRAGSYQEIMAGGNVSVLAGTVTGMTAAIEVTGGSQVIGETYLFNNDASGSIIVQAGTGAATGTSAWISASGSQTLRAGGTLSVTGGADSSHAEIVAGGSQTIGLNSGSYDATDAITLTGGSGVSAYAHIVAGSSQSVQNSGNIALAGGTGASAGARLQSATSQTITTQGNLTVVAGTGSDAEVNQTGAGTQSLNVSGTVTVNNPGGALAGIVSGGAQNLTADNVTVTVSSGVAAAAAEITAAGTQTITLNGTGSTNAFLTILNHSGAAGSIAKVGTTGAQTITMPYTAAGTLRVGDTSSLGEAWLVSGANQSLLVGDLIVQGGATAAASSKVEAGAGSTMDISALTGSIQVLGGAAGSAAIDPAVLNMATNGSIVVQAGAAATATATITAGNINMAATNGSIAVTGGSASASIVATGTMSAYASGNMVITNGTVSAGALTGNNIFLGGSCIGCTTGLVGVFNINSGLLPVVTTAGVVLLVDPGSGEIIALLDSLQDLYTLTLTEEGEIVYDFGRRRIPQCS